MTNTSPPETTTTPARPARPDLFASPPSGAQPAKPRISVLASLDPHPAPAPRSSRRPLWLALAGIAGVSVLSIGIWLVANQPAPSESLAAHPSAPRPAASAAASAETVHAHQEIAAPASIETIPSEPASDKTITTAASDSATEPPAAQAPVEPASAKAETPESGTHKSLLSTLAAKPEAPVKSTGNGRTNNKKSTRTERDATDTDVILLEALVAHNKKKNAANPEGEVKP